MLKNALALVCLSSLLQVSLAEAYGSTKGRYRVPVVEVKVETDPIPAGLDETDDPAIWVHPEKAHKSLIFGTSKFDDDPTTPGGLGVYDLKGREVAFFPVGKLNNVDLIVNKRTGEAYAFASNRERDSLSIFSISATGNVRYLGDSPVVDENGQVKEPYGLCTTVSSRKNEVIVTFKDGTLQRYEMDRRSPLDLTLKSTVDLKPLVTSRQDEKIIANVVAELTADDELDELDEELEERFILEGCAYDEDYERLYVGMEKLGVWAIEDEGEASLPIRVIWEITASMFEYTSSPLNEYHLTDDVEGISIYKEDDEEGVIIVSSQGIDEYILFDRESLDYIGSFKAVFGDDPITHTDGLAVSAQIQTEEFPEGLLVVHDDENGPGDGPMENANFKLISWEDVMDSFDEDDD